MLTDRKKKRDEKVESEYYVSKMTRRIGHARHRGHVGIIHDALFPIFVHYFHDAVEYSAAIGSNLPVYMCVRMLHER